MQQSQSRLMTPILLRIPISQLHKLPQQMAGVLTSVEEISNTGQNMIFRQAIQLLYLTA